MKISMKRSVPFDWLRHLQPDYVLDDITLLDEKMLKEAGMKAIAFDADSTLVEHNAMTVGPEILRFLKTLKLPIYITTNRRAPKGDELGEIIGARRVIHASREFRKPQPEYFQELFRKSSIDLKHTALVGDRLFTDIAGGNRSGLVTVYVKALGKDPFYMKYTGLRAIENLLVRVLTRR